MPRRPAPPAVADRLHSAAIHLLRLLRREDEASGLSAARLSALSVIVFGGPVTIGRLARAEQVRPPTMTRLVMGMEAEGLLVRSGDPEDGRVVWLRATPRGTRILREGRERRVAALARELERLSAADLALLARAAELMDRVAAGSDRTP
ncbi:MAG TPA: MarR family transcriptional regulator [Gemmatimonadales bacterium]